LPLCGALPQPAGARSPCIGAFFRLPARFLPQTPAFFAQNAAFVRLAAFFAGFPAGILCLFLENHFFPLYNKKERMKSRLRLFKGRGRAVQKIGGMFR